ncbi:MAG: hypothetical protein HXL55_06035 [Solobacterium sp.]|nr:hypothetical protein [Solobacterium sp.]
MTYRSGFFNAKQNTDGSYDRTYDADDISNYLGGLISDGVVQSSADALQVSVEQASMQVQIRPGRAFLNNRWFTADSVITLPLTRAHGTLSRITAVALRFDEVNREVTPMCIDGTLASSPAAPQLDDKYLLLALVAVPANPSNLSQITVTDSRKFVHALVNYDFDQSVLQKEYIKAFNAWFEGIKGQLSTDAAGNLQNQINSINPKITGIANDLKKTNDKMKWKYIGTLKQSNTRINISSEYSEVLAVYTSKGTSYDVKDFLVIPLSNAGYYDFFVDRTDKNAAHTFRFYNGTTYVLQNSLLKADDTIDIYVK